MPIGGAASGPVRGERFLESRTAEGAPQLSPDGRWLAYVDEAGGGREIFVRAYPGPGGPWQISSGGGNEPQWNPQGGELFYRIGDRMMAVRVDTRSGFSAGVPRELFRGNFLTTFGGYVRANYDVSHDGQHFVMLQSLDQAPDQALNLAEDLERELGRELADVPRDPSADLTKSIAERERVEGAISRQRRIADTARTELDRMGVIARRRNRAKATERQRRIEDAGKVEARLSAKRDDMAARQRSLHKEAEIREAWVVRHAPQVRERFALERELWWREHQRALAAEVAMPTYLSKAVGERPDAPSERAAWRQAVRAIEAYRERWGVTDESSALGARRVSYKGSPTNLVTEMDARAEALVLDRLRAAFPDDAVLGEEGGARAGGSGRRWLVDPLDGTTNYAHGVPIYAVSIGLEAAGRLALGVLYDPSLDELFVAERGAGATVNDVPCAVSTTATLDESLLATGFPYNVRETPDNNLAEYAAFSLRARGVRRLGSAVLYLAWLAAGRFDGYWELRLGPWDVAAGALLVAEAGGRVTDLDGGPLDLDAPRIVASNGLVHDEMLRVLKAVAAERGRG